MTDLDDVALAAAKTCFLRSFPLSVVPWERRHKPTHVAQLSFQASSAAGDARFPISAEICLRYRDFSCNETERSCLVQSAFAYGRRTYINAYCFKRSDLRTFQIDSILSVNGRNIIDDVARRKLITDVFRMDDDLTCTDFFVHPEAFHAYIMPLAILKRKAEDSFISEAEKFRLLLTFCTTSLSRGFWKDWSSIQKAAGLALAGLTLDVTLVDWKAESARLKRGRFSLKTFREMATESRLS